MNTIQHLIMRGGFYENKSMSEDTTNVTAYVLNKELVRMASDAMAFWESKVTEAEALWETEQEARITEVIETNKTFWARRTRTRDEAIAYLDRDTFYGSWRWGLDSARAIRRAKTKLNRATEIRDLASEPNFKHITLPEDDLRLVGGLSE